MSKLKIYTQNVSCDRHSEMLEEQLGKEFKFKNRFNHVLKSIDEEKPDVVGLNEIRYDENVEVVTDLLEKNNFEAKSFKNNGDKMSFSNVLAVNKSSKWKVDKWQHSWVSTKNNKPALANQFSTIEGDAHGRCAGVVYLKQKNDSENKVCVAISHVVPFGEVKEKQQNALFSLNSANLDLKPPVPTLIVGDLNRFSEENTKFQAQLQEFKLKESIATKLVIPVKKPGKDIEFSDPNDIGTFTPWPVEKEVHKKLIKTPLCESKLDVQTYSDSNLIKNELTINKASMMHSPNNKPPSTERNKVRHLLDKVMASDHLAIVGTYIVNEHKNKSKKAKLN